MIHLPNLVNALVFSLLGIVVLGVAFKVLDLLTPTSLWHEIIEEHNQALAIVIGALAIGVSIVIGAAIKG